MPWLKIIETEIYNSWMSQGYPYTHNRISKWTGSENCML